ncbi:MAG TPA: glycoside hydrolase family 3 N-terminal domain-containing protein, partial [bacterium]|nr:glycoside hydrolase family 3 N-terminal domain-containing protein [bacterium]
WPKLSPVQWLFLKRGWAGGVILYDQDVKSPGQVRDFVKSLRALSPTPLWVAVDQEGGGVRRFCEEQGFASIPSEQAIGRTGDSRVATRFGEKLGQQLAEAGVNLDFAPVVDLDQEKPVGIITGYQRSLGSDPEEVALLAGQIVRAMDRFGVAAAAKHFPGESLASQNPHEAPALAREPLDRIRSRDLVPYRRLITGGLDAVMLSHVTYAAIDPDHPASLSPKVIQGLLRGELGFKGLVICDDLQMGAIRKNLTVEEAALQAVNAGVDLIIATGDTSEALLDGLVAAAREGKISLAQARESYGRIQTIRAKYLGGGRK